MSELIVEATRISEILPHPNADRLELAIVKGWQIVVGKGHFHTGDSVLHIPPDSILQKELAEKLDVWKYLSVKKDSSEGRVRAVRLRQEVSFGFVIPNGDQYPEGIDLKDTLGIKKWEPPPAPYRQGDQDVEHPLFHKYTSICNIRDFPSLFKSGEEVVYLEKLHGTNSVLGFIHTGSDYEFMIGSHCHRRKLGTGSLYELPLTDSVKELLKAVAIERDTKSVVLFGEIFGAGIQDLGYGLRNPTFRAFDLSISGRYLNFDELEAILCKYGVDMAPLLYRGPYTEQSVKSCTSGLTTLMGNSGHMREGIVIRPVRERYDSEVGRVILKSISDDYLLRKDGTEYH